MDVRDSTPPEWWCDGDPYLDAINKYDEYIDICVYEHGESAYAEAMQMTRKRDAYEIETLARWVDLPSPWPPWLM